MQTVNKYLYYITIIIAAIFFLSVLPDFSFKLNDTYSVEWKGLSTLGISDNLFNFSRGKGIYLKNRVTTTAKQGELEKDVFLRTFQDDKAVVMSRLMLVNGLLNADLESREYLLTNEDKRSLVFDFPEYITSSDTLARSLTSKGEVEIVVSSNLQAPAETDNSFTGNESFLELYFPGYKAVTSGLTLKDITNFSVGTSNIITTPVLRTTFNEQSKGQIDTAFSNTVYDQTGNPRFPLVMMIDGFPEFWAFPSLQVSQQSASTTKGPVEIVWIPLFETERINIATKVATIFGGGKVNLSYDYSEVETVNPEYAPEGRIFIAVALIVFVILMILRAAISLGRTGGIYYAIGFGSFILTAVGLAKLFNVAIDPIMVMTFTIFTAFIGNALYANFNSSQEELNQNLSTHLNLAILMFFIVAILTQLPLVSLIRGYEVMLVMSICLFISSLVYFRGVLQMYYLSQRENATK